MQYINSSKDQTPKAYRKQGLIFISQSYPQIQEQHFYFLLKVSTASQLDYDEKNSNWLLMFDAVRNAYSKIHRKIDTVYKEL